MNFTVTDYLFWQNLIFKDDYPGYRPEGYEQPDGDIDGGSGYEYSHIAPKYLRDWKAVGSDIRTLAYDMLASLNRRARVAAMTLGIGPEFLPVMEDGTLRLLRYPPGTYNAEHTDFCLLTIPLYRNDWTPYFYTNGEQGLHIGEIMEQLTGTKATNHGVRATGVWQYSAVYFAMPPLFAVLPNDMLVTDWVEKRKKETRNATNGQ
jgi:isopenicillin N synthase-like dioxygenase